MATKHQIEQWRRELNRDYANCEPYFVDLVLDMYEKNPEYLKKAVKKKYKEVKNETPKEILGAVDIVHNPSDEYIDKYFKKPIELKEEDVTA